MADVTVRVEGLAQLRRDLRTMGAELDRELRDDLKRAAEREVLPTARALAPRKTGRLASSLRVTARGNRVSISSRVPYANVQHWGGTTGRGHQLGHGATRVQGTYFITRAATQNLDRMTSAVGDEFIQFARRHGWR